MRSARRLVAWGMLTASLLLGCRENVYLGNPIGAEDHALPDGAPADGPSDASADVPFERDAASEPEPPFPWYLHAVGSKILDSNDAVVHVRGISWSGMQT